MSPADFKQKEMGLAIGDGTLILVFVEVQFASFQVPSLNSRRQDEIPGIDMPS
jgi:hypothetical protein